MLTATVACGIVAVLVVAFMFYLSTHYRPASDGEQGITYSEETISSGNPTFGTDCF